MLQRGRLQRPMVGVAQLAERQVVVLDVVGSSPIVHPNICAGQRPDGNRWRPARRADVRFWERSGSRPRLAAARIGASKASTMATADRGERRARSWSADSQTICNPLLISSRIAGVMWL